MRSPLRARMGRFLAAAGLTAALLIPAAAPVASQENLVLRIGSTQSLDAVNPYKTALVIGYEAFLPELRHARRVRSGPRTAAHVRGILGPRRRTAPRGRSRSARA